MIEAHQLTKRYGDKTAVEDLSFTVRPGIVTGFLGPNGAGKRRSGKQRIEGVGATPGRAS
jgi:ABC-2 type transport system ATP-binding protein